MAISLANPYISQPLILTFTRFPFYFKMNSSYLFIFSDKNLHLTCSILIFLTFLLIIEHDDYGTGN